MSTSLIKVYSGKLVDLANPEKADLDIGDIAHHLSLINRWTGASHEAFSVGQHCIVGSVLAEKIYPDVKWLPHAFILHDACEAYLGDVSTPLKRLLPQYIELENRWQRRIEQVFMVSLGGQWEKTVDLRMMATENYYYMTEGNDLLGATEFTFDEFYWACGGDMHDTGEKFQMDLYGVWEWLWQPWTPKQTEDLYIRRLRKLHII